MGLDKSAGASNRGGSSQLLTSGQCTHRAKIRVWAEVCGAEVVGLIWVR
jgi:hypothetical protein